MKDVELSPFELNCTAYNIDAADCMALNSVVDKLESYHLELVELIKRTHETINQTLPANSRQRRHIFSFVGRWLHDLTVTMDEDQAKKIDKDFRTLRAQARHTQKQLISDENRFKTYVDKSRRQYDVINSAIRNVSSNIVALRQILSKQSGLLFQLSSTVRLLINTIGQAIAAAQSNN